MGEGGRPSKADVWNWVNKAQCKTCFENIPTSFRETYAGEGVIFISVSKVHNIPVCKLKVVACHVCLRGAQGSTEKADRASDPEAINLEGTRGIYRINKVKAITSERGARRTGGGHSLRHFAPKTYVILALSVAFLHPQRQAQLEVQNSLKPWK